jgi:hypothetical protein
LLSRAEARQTNHQHGRLFSFPISLLACTQKTSKPLYGGKMAFPGSIANLAAERPAPAAQGRRQERLSRRPAFDTPPDQRPHTLSSISESRAFRKLFKGLAGWAKGRNRSGHVL